MKLKREVSSYEAPAIGIIESVVLDTGVQEMLGHYYPLRQIDPEHMAEIRNDSKKKDIIGLPMVFTVIDKKFVLYPAPDSDDYKMLVRYYPPRIEI